MTFPPRDDDAWTVHVSDALQARLDTYRDHDPDRTTTSVVFDAIEQLRTDIPEVVRTARARPVSPNADQSVRYLGTGPVVIRVRPTAEQARLCDEVTEQLDLPTGTWLPPLLNAYLPGRKEPENMPWLVLEHTREPG